MDWYLLRYFLAVAELGNFSRAAGQVNVTQPTLSAGIAKLESQLGHRLFERNKRRVALTPAGSRFLVHAQRIAHGYEMALRDISGAPARRALRAGILTTLPTVTVEALVTRHQAQPGAEALEITDGSERELKTRLEDGRLDCALTILPPGADRTCCETLAVENYVLITPRRHRLAQEQTVRGEELAEDSMIIRRHCEVLAATSRYFTERGVRPSFGLKTKSDERALALVRAGLGVTVMPDSFTDPGIKQIKLADFDLRREIGLIFSESGRAMADSMFVQAAREAFGKN